MTMRFSLNNAFGAAAGNSAAYAWKAFMITASPGGPGWTVTRSNNGTTAGAGDNIASAADFSNANAWVVLQMPTTGRELCLARTGNSTNHYWRLVYSQSAGFTGGSTSARPTATDEKYIFGDATPSAATALFHSNNFNLNFIADDAAPYGFACVGFKSSFGLGVGFYMDPMLTGSFDVADQDPYVFYAIDSNQTDGAVTSSLCSETDSFTGSGCRAYVGDLSTTARWGNCSALKYANHVREVYPGANGPTQNLSGSVPDLPIIYARSTAVTGPSGLKGVSSMFKWNGANTANGDTVASRTYAVWNNLLIPWDGSTTPTG